jgi:transposase-like protein
MAVKKQNLSPEEISEMKRKAIMARWKDKSKPSAPTYELIREACADGATVANICHVLGIVENTFYRWKDTYPEFAKAVKEGRRIEHDRLVNKLVEMALRGNIAALIYALKARHDLLDNQVNNVIENKVAITFQLPDAMRPEDYLRTLTAEAEVIKPSDAARVLAKPGVKGKVLKELVRVEE